jgi:predicted ATPase/DNA-binding CsgD family transcriptional regulator
VNVTAEGKVEAAGRLHGLRPTFTSFVGRSDAVATLSEMLGQYRLVTVTGAGGVGKTRLAEEVTRRAAGQFADGAWMIELATVREPALVPVAVATALGIRQAPGISITDTLTASLAQRQLLLVLDNCEHVLDAVTQFCAAVLTYADDVRILSTSREPLGLAAEARYRLAPLALPDRNNLGEAESSEAVTLFADRARQLDPRFRLDHDSRGTVIRLVQRLDGIPLAIELAAARIESLGLAQLDSRLDDRFHLLVSANRAADARQRSLEAAIDWSYQLLTDGEQRVLRQLSVFPGPFTLDAAEAVAGAEARLAVLRLVDCSLLAPPRGGPDGRSRYSMLETLRIYSTGRLRENGEEDQASSALARYALKVAGQANAQMTAADLEKPAALWLDAEDAAIHQGLLWALEHDPAVALRIAVALASWWRLRGRWVQGYTLLLRAVEQNGPEADGRASALIWLGRLHGSYDSDALGYYNQAVEILRATQPSAELVDALVSRSGVLSNLGRLPEAADDSRAALDLARRLEYFAGEAGAITSFVVIASYAGDGEQGLEWARQAQLVNRDRLPGWDARDVASCVLFAVVQFAPHDVQADVLEQTLEAATEAGDTGHQAQLLYLMVVRALDAGRLSEAQEKLRESIELATYVADRMRLIDVMDECGYVCAAMRRYAEAVTLWAARDVQCEANGMLILTPYEEDRRRPWLEEASAALGAGQFEFAQKRGSAMTLDAAAEFALMMSTAGSAATEAPQGKLSPRERELVTLVAQGKTDAQIAGQLFISVRTVRTHLDRIRDKSGCRRRADLTRLALEAGII